MKKVGLITTNKVFAQSLAATAENHPDWGFELVSLLDPKQAVLDAQVMEIDTAVVDAGCSNENDTERFCQTLRKTAGCRLLLFVPKTGRALAIRAMKSRAADDFVFYDTSLEYLLAKLAAIE